MGLAKRSRIWRRRRVILEFTVREQRGGDSRQNVDSDKGKSTGRRWRVIWDSQYRNIVDTQKVG